MIKRSCLCVALMLALAGAPPVSAQSEARHTIGFQAQDLGTALRLLAQQTKLQIVYSADLVQGKQAPALNGSLTATEALSQLLRGSGLEYEFLDPQTVTLSESAGSAQDRSGKVGQAATSGVAPIAQGEQANATPLAPIQQDRLPSVAKGSDRTQDLEKITVTGTRIRGGETPSPLITIGSERIQEEGFTDLGEVIRSIPQNFSGGQNPGVAVGASLGAGGLSNQNLTGGSTLNLRGLGPDATLTLINGRRMAYGGFVQAVDISAIPVDAVDRIEIVPDGASAIYGSDAVGGVGNVILKRDYDGVAVGVRYGGATEGGLATREYSATAGTTWSSGGLIATYKDVSSEPIYARQRGYTAHMFHPTSLRADTGMRSGLISLYQTITDSVELQLDALRSKREQDLYRSNTGLTSWHARYQPRTTTSLVSPNIKIAMPGDWALSVSGSRGRDEHIQYSYRIDTATGVRTTPIEDACYCNEAYSYELGAEGPLFAMPAGDARLAIGVGSRKNEYVQHNYLTDTDDIQGNESSRFAYAELRLPLVSPGSGIAGARRLELTAALRGEDYESFGSVTTPKLGLIYAPSADFTLKTSWGKSFKTPTLFQKHWARYAIVDSPSFYGGTGYGPEETVLAVLGGNPDLGAERATTWAASVAIHPESLRNLQAELTWFDIDYTDRVVEPITNYAQAMVLPEYDQFFDRSPTAQTQEEIIASADLFFNRYGGPYIPENVVAIMYGRYVNVARQRINGIDLSASYRFDLGPGRLTMRGSSSWLEITQQNNAVNGPYDVAGTIFNPAKLNGRFGAVWTQGGFMTSIFVNYTDGVTNTVNDEKTASFTTFDATLRYATSQGSGPFSGLEFALSAQNLFNREPPLYAAAALERPPYDSTNYSAIGRFLSLSVHKRW